MINSPPLLSKLSIVFKPALSERNLQVDAIGVHNGAAARKAPDRVFTSTNIGRNKKKGGLSEEQLDDVREAFGLFEDDTSGEIDVRELKAAMRSLGFEVKNEEVQNEVTPCRVRESRGPCKEREN